MNYIKNIHWATKLAVALPVIALLLSGKVLCLTLSVIGAFVLLVVGIIEIFRISEQDGFTPIYRSGGGFWDIECSAFLKSPWFIYKSDKGFHLEYYGGFFGLKRKAWMSVKYHETEESLLETAKDYKDCITKARLAAKEFIKVEND